MATTKTNYEDDFYAWANEQAAKLRSGQLTELDIEHIAEELETLGRSEKRELTNRLTVLLTHLLKWQFQPQWRSVSWEVSIDNQRLKIADHLQDNPSLNAQLDEAITRAYRLAVGQARKQTKLDKSTFPTQCPYTHEQILRDDFLPD